MILTGAAIAAAVADGEITIDPFDPGLIDVNSYTFRLGNEFRRSHGPLDINTPTSFERVVADPYITLEPGWLYLARTLEATGSDRYAQLLNGNQSMGSLGIWVHVSAPLAHMGTRAPWTLELRAAAVVRVAPGMRFGKIIFIETLGEPRLYRDTEAKYSEEAPLESQLFLESPQCHA